MRTWRWLLLAFLSIGCGDFSVGCGVEAPPPSVAESASTGVPHGDHSPHHGGVVMMKGDLHYEVVLDQSGRYRLYFTDAMRADLPAATASRASIIVTRPGEPPESIDLRIDDAGESWIGEGRGVSDAAKTMARVSFTVRGQEPYWIDLPFDAKPTRTGAHQ
jgi:hypothetical protein